MLRDSSCFAHTLSHARCATPLRIVQVPWGQQHHDLDTLARLPPPGQEESDTTDHLLIYIRINIVRIAD